MSILRPLMMLVTRRDWRGVENLPTDTGVIIAANHLSWADPIVIGHFLNDNGYVPQYMAKAELFAIPVLGRILRGAKQIPVYRRTPDAAQALRHAVAALKAGGCLVIYPEGTITRDPDRWPMLAKTGVARLALLTGAPVVPVAQWGAQDLLAYHEKRPHLIPPKHVAVHALPPVDLSAYADAAPTVETLRTITDLIMAPIRAELAEIRGEPAPEAVFDPRRLHPVADDDARRSA